jgi:hypothetical protein
MTPHETATQTPLAEALDDVLVEDVCNALREVSIAVDTAWAEHDGGAPGLDRQALSEAEEWAAELQASVRRLARVWEAYASLSEAERT